MFLFLIVCEIGWLIRPPVTVVREVLCFTRDVFLFLSPASLRHPSTDRRETLPHDRKLVRLDKFSPKIRGAPLPPPSKKWGEGKHMHNFGQFSTTFDFDREYLRNWARYRKSENMWSRAIPSAFDEKGELWSTNGLEFYVSLDPLKCTFSQTIFQPIGGAAPWNFYTR